MQPYLNVSVREQDQSTVIELDGELDLGSSPQLERALEDARREPALVIVDLAKLRFLDMAGLRVLMGAKERFERSGGRLVLTNVPDAVRRTIRLAEVTGVLTMLENGV